MNRSEFMAELRRLLVSIPEDEREEALQYYEDYFEDAGPENEEQVVKELGSPEKVAAIIWTDTREGSEESGEFTENGYTDVRFEEKEHLACREDVSQEQNEHKKSEREKKERAENAYSYRESTYTTNGQGVGSDFKGQASESGEGHETDGGYASGSGYGQSGDAYHYNQNGGYGQDGAGRHFGNQAYRSRRRAADGMRANKAAKTIMIIVLAVLLLRMVGWLIPAALGVIFGIVGVVLAVLGCLIGFALAGVGVAIAGVVLLVVGIGGLTTTFASAILLMGVGFLMLGLGAAAFIGFVKLCLVIYPALFRGIVNLVRKIFVRREVA